jgi:hypothetical protein
MRHSNTRKRANNKLSQAQIAQITSLWRKDVKAAGPPPKKVIRANHPVLVDLVAMATTWSRPYKALIQEITDQYGSLSSSASAALHHAWHQDKHWPTPHHPSSPVAGLGKALPELLHEIHFWKGSFANYLKKVEQKYGPTSKKTRKRLHLEFIRGKSMRADINQLAWLRKRAKRYGVHLD